MIINVDYFLVVDEVNRKDEVSKFLAENRHLLVNQMKDVQVTTMRHILPQLLMEAYSDHYASYMRKGKRLFLIDCHLTDMSGVCVM